MADQTDFKHITVNSGDGDDVVIHAGIVEPTAVEPVPAPRAAGDADGVAPADKPVAAADKPVAANPTASSALRPSGRPAAASPKDAYHETTLEDIEGSKMPKTQIIVIALAVIGIAAFVIWNLVTA